MVLCIPLGLALKDSEGKGHYGSGEACWLRYDTHFVWAFIVPVLLIIIVSAGESGESWESGESGESGEL